MATHARSVVSHCVDSAPIEPLFTAATAPSSMALASSSAPWSPTSSTELPAHALTVVASNVAMRALIAAPSCISSSVWSIVSGLLPFPWADIQAPYRASS